MNVCSHNTSTPAAISSTSAQSLNNGHDAFKLRHYQHLISTDAYRLAITVHPIDDANINIVANLKLAGESLSLSMVLELGQPGQIRTGTRRLDLIVEK